MDAASLKEQRDSVLLALKSDPNNADLKTLLNDVNELFALSGLEIPDDKPEPQRHIVVEEENIEEAADEDDMFAPAEAPQRKKQKTDGVAERIIPDVQVEIENITNYIPLQRFVTSFLRLYL